MHRIPLIRIFSFFLKLVHRFARRPEKRRWLYVRTYMLCSHVWPRIIISPLCTIHAPRGLRAARIEIRKKKGWLFVFYYRFRLLNGKDTEVKRVPEGVVQQIFEDLKKIHLLSCLVWNVRILSQADVKTIFWISTDRSTSSLFLLTLRFL